MADGTPDPHSLMERDFEAFPPRNWVETGAKNFRRFVLFPLVNLKGKLLKNQLHLLLFYCGKHSL